MKSHRVLVLGSGAREHALAKTLQKSPGVEQIFLHPGNDGCEQEGLPSLGELGGDDYPSWVAQAQARGISLVVIGPETLLYQGVADLFREQGIATVGPSKQSAELEASKIFAKEFMVEAAIPTASYFVCESFTELQEQLASYDTFPVVLKADGLAAGKGVLVAQSLDEALEFGQRVLEQNCFGHSKPRLLVEEALPGEELSYILLTDGKSFVPMASATDYKRAFDQDEGPNTGGMGCISPSPFLDEALESQISQQIITPFLKTLKKRKMEFRGILFLGLMVNEQRKAKVLEFNTRFGDPETQATLLRLESDFLPLLDHLARGTLAEAPLPKWSSQASIYVVGAAKGYPQNPQKGDLIEGLETLESSTSVFFAGVKKLSPTQPLATHGGRVLGLGVCAPTLPQARTQVYNELSKISWNGMFYRKDIGEGL